MRRSIIGAVALTMACGMMAQEKKLFTLDDTRYPNRCIMSGGATNL